MKCARINVLYNQLIFIFRYEIWDRTKYPNDTYIVNLNTTTAS